MKYLNFKNILGFIFIFVFVFTQSTFASHFLERKDVKSFLHNMVTKYNFNATSLNKVFANVTILPKVLKHIKTPYEAKPWYIYRQHFIKANRIKQGVQFWNKYAEPLNDIEKKYGVPRSIMVSIIGVESHYGQHLGKFPVLDSLATLAFDYPPRAEFFRKELEQFLLLTREQKLDPTKVYGSYAGAIGLPQFMPSSYRSYAVDFEQNGQIDLVSSNTDALASIGNYLAKNGWHRNGLIAVKAKVTGNNYHKFLNKGRKPLFSLSQLAKHGITPIEIIKGDPKAILIELKMGKLEKPEFWLGFQNLYVITRYNTSVLYAMAVYQLGEKIKLSKEHAKITG